MATWDIVLIKSGKRSKSSTNLALVYFSFGAFFASLILNAITTYLPRRPFEMENTSPASGNRDDDKPHHSKTIPLKKTQSQLNKENQSILNYFLQKNTPSMYFIDDLKQLIFKYLQIIVEGTWEVKGTSNIGTVISYELSLTQTSPTTVVSATDFIAGQFISTRFLHESSTQIRAHIYTQNM